MTPPGSRGTSILMVAFRAIFALFVLLVSTTAFGFGQAPKIMPYGDSITEGGYIVDGQYHSEDGGYRIVLWRLLTQAGYQAHFVGSNSNGDFPESHHEGHSGWRIDQVDEHSQEWVRDAAPDYVLLMIGTNDCIQNYQFDTVISRLDALIQHIQQSAPGAQLFVASLFHTAYPDINARIDRYNAGLEALVSGKSATDPRIHLVTDFKSSITTLVDGVHPGPLGYPTMGKIWFNILAPYLKN